MYTIEISALSLLQHYVQIFWAISQSQVNCFFVCNYCFIVHYWKLVCYPVKVIFYLSLPYFCIKKFKISIKIVNYKKKIYAWAALT